MIGKYKVITLCGSTKFKDEFLQAQKQLTLEGNIVISVGLFGHADSEFGNVITPEIKVMLDDIHKRKIDMSDEIYVINKNGYIGESTKGEIDYAIKTGKGVNYLEYYQDMKNKSKSVNSTGGSLPKILTAFIGAKKLSKHQAEERED